MRHMYYLNPVIKNYAWGSPVLIPDLCHLPKTEEPVAELWLGDHPAGMATLQQGITLSSFLSGENSEFISLKAHKAKLDFLFKVLAVHKPLSLQVHPNQHQALEGFKRENKENIPLLSAKRTYKDASAKAEMLYALSDFFALAGILPTSTIVDNLSLLQDLSFWRNWSLVLQKQPYSPKNIQKLCHSLYHHTHLKQLIEDTLNLLKNQVGSLGWINRLYVQFGADMGVLAPLWMNVIHLKKGEALFLYPTCLHAYLHGFGLELMTSSDNVVRLGLTSKYKNEKEFMQVANFSYQAIEKVKPDIMGKGLEFFAPKGENFVLQRVNLEKNEDLEIERPFMSLCFTFSPVVLILEGDQLYLTQGQAALISASRYKLRIRAYESQVELFLATWQG